jgi:membrane protein YdbS with pleckstrin-like domain
LHALAFKLYGASTIKFKWNWSLFRFNIQANDFVLSKRKYYLVCIITFFIFSVLPLILAFFAGGLWLFALLSLSFFHALYAMKDLAVCSYLYKFSNCYIYSSEENQTIFYKSVP